MLHLENEYFRLDGFALPAQLVLTNGASGVSLNYQVAGTDANVLLPASGKVQRAAKWVQGESTSLKYIYLKLKRNGTISSGKLQVAIVRSSSGLPSSDLVDLSLPIDASGVSTSAGWVSFTFDEMLLSAGTYHVVLMGDYTASNTNNIAWMGKTVASGGNSSYLDSLTGNWSALDTESLMVYAPLHIVFDDTVVDGQIGYVPMQNVNTQVTCRRGDVVEVLRNSTLTMLDGENTGVSYKVMKVVPEDSDIAVVHLMRSEIV